MNRRTFLSALVVTPVVTALVTACGDDSTADQKGSRSPYPTGPDDVVLKLTSEGGFVPVGADVTFPPQLLISGDGRAFRPGAVPAIFPGPLVMPIGVSTISAKGIEQILEVAGEAGLLGEIPDYSDPNLLVADVPDTVLTITTAAGTFVHRCPALGFGGDQGQRPIDDNTGGGVEGSSESSPARQNLQLFVELLADLPKMVGASEIGSEQIFEPTELRFRSTVMDEGALEGFDPPPTQLDWPADAGVALADATTCATASSNTAVKTLFDADSNTFFLEDGVLYSIAAGARLPGDPQC